MLKVLVAENALSAADRVKEALVGAGYEVCGVACTVAEAVLLGRAHRPDLAVIALQFADGGLGTDIVAQLRKNGRVHVLYVGENLHQFNGLAAGDACIAKPYDTSDLLRALKIVERGWRP